MKLLAILVTVLLVGCGPKVSQNDIEVEIADADGCTVKTASNLVNQHKVGPITNLEKEEFEFGYRNECTVRFDITVNGEKYHLEETESSLEQMASTCYRARERARKNLLLDLGGTFKTESNIRCLNHDRS